MPGPWPASALHHHLGKVCITVGLQIQTGLGSGVEATIGCAKRKLSVAMLSISFLTLPLLFLHSGSALRER